MLGQKLPFAFGHCPVCHDAQQNVVAEPCPTMVVVIEVDGIAEGAVRTVFFFIVHLVAGSLDVVDQDVAGTGCAVVVEIVVAILSVLRLIVCFYGLDDALFRLVVDVECLLYYLSSFTGVFLAKGAEGHNAHLVVCQAEYEPEDEMRLVETEHAVIDGHVDSLSGILIADGGMTLETVNLVVGTTGEQADAHRV